MLLWRSRGENISLFVAAPTRLADVLQCHAIVVNAVLSVRRFMEKLCVIERDLSKVELASVHAGFMANQIEHGVAIQPQDRITFVVMAGERFVGCVSGIRDNNWFYLSDLWLDKHYRGQGLGKSLLYKFESRVMYNHVNNIYTWTAGFEGPVFYEKQGYTIFCELKNYYTTGHSRVGMRKTLLPPAHESQAPTN
jgi:ribosomal protein S18 acetylase RimI-like enzyme